MQNLEFMVFRVLLPGSCLINPLLGRGGGFTVGICIPEILSWRSTSTGSATWVYSCFEVVSITRTDLRTTCIDPCRRSFRFVRLYCEITWWHTNIWLASASVCLNLESTIYVNLVYRTCIDTGLRVYPLGRPTINTVAVQFDGKKMNLFDFGQGITLKELLENPDLKNPPKLVGK